MWPLLRHDGFTKFSTKTAWRYLPEQIHLANFQSFNSFLAAGVGCTTFSFAVNLGIYFPAIPFTFPLRKGPDPALRPQVLHCHLRLQLLKEIEQPVLPRRDVWYVEPDGSNLLEIMADARTVLEREGLPWFKRFESLKEVLRLLMEEEELPEVMATRRSPARRHTIGHIARSLGIAEIATPMIAESESEQEAIRLKVYGEGRKLQK